MMTPARKFARAPFLIALCCLAAFAAAWPAPAKAGVALTPIGVMIEGRQRFADVTVINTGKTTESYSLGWRFMRMTEQGGYVEVSDSTTPFDLSKHVVFTPRRITLAPHSSQRIRMALRLDGEAPPPGDYRAHFVLRQISEKASHDDIDPTRPNVSVNINIGFSIPVVYRVGESDATARLGEIVPRVNPKNKKLEVTVPITKNQSNYGILGNLLLFNDLPDGKEMLVGQISNAHIFPEVTARTFTVPLNVDSLDRGTLRVVYKEQDKAKKHVYDEKVIPIGH